MTTRQPNLGSPNGKVIAPGRIRIPFSITVDPGGMLWVTMSSSPT